MKETGIQKTGQQIVQKTYDEERALYHLQNTTVRACTFAGPADGESALKEAENVELIDCRFSLRYPLWHVKGFVLEDCSMDEKTRAAIWYAEDGQITGCTLDGIKCLRECDRIAVEKSVIHSPECGWKCRDISFRDTEIESEYFLLEGQRVQIDSLTMRGKYSFQYVENMEIRNSELDTKDAFWHSKHVTVRDSIIKGEYLGWYAEDLTLINCHITGTQPLCYCKGLRLIGCTMEGTDLAFEYSEVEAEVKGEILSVKNPKSGRIQADRIGEIILEDAVMECRADIITASWNAE